MSEKVKVKIEAYQRVQYVQTKWVSKERYDQYCSMVDTNCTDRDFDREFEDLIEYHDICDSEELEDFYMSLVTDK